MSPAQPQKSFLAAHGWKFALVIVLGASTATGVSVVIYNGVAKIRLANPVVAQGVQIARTDSRVLEALGNPVEPFGIPDGNVDGDEGRAQANVRVSLEGSRDQGTLVIVGTADNGLVKHKTLQLHASGGAVDLLDVDTVELEGEDDLEEDDTDTEVEEIAPLPDVTNPNIVLPDLEPLPEDDLERAKVLLNKGKAAEARAIIDKLLAEDPNNAPALMIRGQIWERATRFSRAREDFARAAKLTPDNPRAHESLALVAAASRDYTGCVDHFDRVIELEPKVAANFHRRADCRELAGNEDLARVDREAACELDAQHPSCQPEVDQDAGTDTDADATEGESDTGDEDVAER